MKTNKIYSLLIVMLFNISLINQAHAVWRFGPIVGYRMNMMATDAVGVTYKTTGKYQLGGLLDYKFLETFEFRTGLIYAVKDVSGSDLGGVSSNVKATYFDIPLDLMVYLPITSLYILGGVKFGMKSSSSCDYGGIATACDIAGTNTMLNVAIGYNLFNIADTTLGGELEYEMGTSNINNNSTGGSLKPSSLNLNFALLF